jgi:DNA-binding MltR family transcriptional regulator
MVWILDKYDDETIKQLDRHDDRSAAILAAACLEDRLEQVLRTAFEPHKTIVDAMLKGYGPLASFKSKIDLCFALGMIDENLYKIMNRNKEIRNEFAHRPQAKTFQSQRIADLCSNFKKIEKLPKRFKPPTFTTKDLLKMIKDEVKEKWTRYCQH